MQQCGKPPERAEVGHHAHALLARPWPVRRVRTHQHDLEPAREGFLWSEGVLRTMHDVSGLVHCGRTGDEGRDNAMEVTLAPGVRVPVDEQGELARRGTLISSACGVCGRRTIDDWLAMFEPLATPEPGELDVALVLTAMRELRDRQPLFHESGGCHAACLIGYAGRAIATFADVGRHNAVDKVVGSRILARELPLHRTVLLVSGRASFEIVQKAVAARIPVIASVSAPSSLAVDLARRAHVTLLGFVRGERYTVYSGPERLRAAPGEKSPQPVI